jgi:hypothetical protein
MFIVVKEVRASAGFVSLPNGDRAPSGLGRMELPSQLGKALPAPKWSNVPNLCSRG